MAEDGVTTPIDVVTGQYGWNWKTGDRGDLLVADELLPRNLEYVSASALHMECL